MADNNSLVGGAVSLVQINYKVIIVQMLVLIFLCINFLLIMTFFRKECFYTTTRYILFAVTLLSDSLMLVMSDILLILHYFGFPTQVWMCIIISVVVLLYMRVTPVTLTAMTLERYVAICMPLRHAELCSTRSTVHCILIIHGLSSVPCIVVLSTFFASASLSLYEQHRLCTVEMFMLYRWQDHVRSAISEFYFLIMVIIILFSYVKIMKVAKAASGEDKKSSWKGLKTVILHGFQLLLCLIQLWTPFIEAAIIQNNVMLFFNVRKECFYTTTRYILFAVTLLSDSFMLFVSNILLILTHFGFPIQVWICVIICAMVRLYNLVTPVTLTVMTLERYVAICMPLRHAELCSTRSTVHCILIIHALSSVPCIVMLCSVFASASLSFYTQHRLCSVEAFMLQTWQSHFRSAIKEFYFLIMVIIIVFSYVKIMKAAKAASGEDKKSSWKGLRTVILHVFQLLLCLIQMWCPFIEAAVLQIDFMLFINVRYSNYILFGLAPRCLSPLIYGLRDETFFRALKNHVLYKRNI
ncbi:hypothetical protein GBF38_012102 [Nibea albiflora]|uniref:Uncharacterized protein n=1 Tax=Nibea albiflora TaxID=240163 RepID=A0ACB7EI37_NIBAL|nr:hypothetical protein GBF38_012102 [Nibea albiflora]